MVKHHTYSKYSATRNGSVYGPKGQEVKGRVDRNGYLKFEVGFYTCHGEYIRKTVLKHRFIYESLNNITLTPEQQINHIDGNKTNNSIANLEICTAQYNVQHAFANGLAVPKNGSEVPWSTLDEDTVRSIITEIMTSNPANYKLALKYKTTSSIITNIRYKQSWLHVFKEDIFLNYTPIAANASKAGIANITKELRLDIIHDLFTTDLTNKQIQDKYNIQYKHLAKVRSKELWKKELIEYENSL